jgi:hypothetical protein
MPRPFASMVGRDAQMRARLHALVHAGATPQALAVRCRIVLRAAREDNPSNQEIAAELDWDRHPVGQ